MGDPMVINEDISGDSLAKVQSLMENLVNHSMVDDSTTQPKCAAPAVEPCASANKLPSLAGQDEKYKRCVIEKGRNKFPDEMLENNFTEAVKGCVLNQDAKVMRNSSPSEASTNIPHENSSEQFGNWNWQLPEKNSSNSQVPGKKN